MSQTTSARISAFGWGSSSLSRTLARRGPFASSGMAIPADVQAQAATHLGASSSPATKGGDKETLFGPVIGEEGDEEEDEVKEAGREREKVGVDVVKGWVEKAKSHGSEPHPTTTLQSLVNLKRPTLHLSTVPSSAKHTLKFTYDLSTPQALLTIHLYLPDPTREQPTAVQHEVVYQAVVEGGFGRSFELPAEGALDLAACQLQVEDALARVAQWKELDGKDKEIGSIEEGLQATTLESNAVPAGGNSSRGPLGRWLARRPEGDLEAQAGGGDVLPMGEVNLAKGGPNDKADQEERGVRKDVRVVVRLEARGERGEALPELNAQRTHVDISYHPPATIAPASDPTSQTAEADSVALVAPALERAGSEGGVRVEVGSEGERKGWFSAKVVRREALIGTHTFQLKEIFGLTSSASPAAAAAVEATYPPTAAVVEDEFNTNQAGSSAPNECIVCLVSPRDVVLLPCRHLVVCKECAVGMVEFGAGGKVLRREDGAAELGANTTAGGEGGAAAGEGAETTPAAAAGETGEGSGEVRVDAAQQARQEARRRRKAKGWFCPVCRQPYTSLLRIALPSTKLGLERTITAVSAHSHHAHASTGPAALGSAAVGEKTAGGVSEEEVGGVYLARAPSPVPTLPGRAESVLYPDEEEEREVGEGEARPTFVLGDDEGEGEGERRRKVEGLA